MDSNRLWVLKRVNLFHGLSVEQSRRVHEAGQAREYQRRQLIFTPEDRGDAVYLIKDGRVKLSRFDDRGREITLAILEEGELFGEEAMAPGELRRGYAEALSPVKLLRLGRGEFERLLQENPELGLAVVQQMTQRLFGANSALEALAFRDVPQRLASVLLRLAERYGAKVAGGGLRIELLLTHQELASMIASTRETTTTLLNRLKRDGVLESEGRWLIVRDLQRLRALASAG